MQDIHGTYAKTLFKDRQNGYTIFTFLTRDLEEYMRNGKIYCAGKIPDYGGGMPLKLTGEIQKKNNNYTFMVSSCEQYSNDIEITIAYLSSDDFEGIGEKTAKKIVNYTGPDIFKFVKNKNAEYLLSTNISELRNGKAQKLIETINKTAVTAEVFKYISKFGGTYVQSAKIIEEFGNNGLKQLKLDPYYTGHKVGMPFGVSDNIAKNENFHPFDRKRVTAIIFEALTAESNAGNTYCRLKNIYKCAEYIAYKSAYNIEIPPEVIATTLNSIKGIVVDKSNNDIKVYSKSLWHYENEITAHLSRIVNSSHELNFSTSAIEKIEKTNKIHYSDKQKEAFEFLKSTGLKILTGGPGTGKTTVLKGIIQAYELFYPNNNITLCAPTARASQRLSEATGMVASTIHKVLEFKPFGNEMVFKNQQDPLTADFIVIDEVSMIDTQIFAFLLAAIKNGALILLCGDSDQLPSVGAGNILSDLIKTKKFELVELDVIYRQSELSSIITNAYAINNGNANLTESKDFEIITYDEPESAEEKILEIVGNHYDPASPFDLQVLTSVKKDILGTNNLNKKLQEICTPVAVESLRSLLMNFRVGDKVMQIKNNYRIPFVKSDGEEGNGIFNGDIGIVKNIAEDGCTVEVEFNDKYVIYDSTTMDELKLAYAMTIHKSQGSEFPICIVVLPSNPTNMLKRNLLYTAVTRASEKVYIIAQSEAIEKAIITKDGFRRRTTLKEKLLKSLGYN